ncbi:MAG: pyruvate, phosphate dikinase [Acidimicrobiales bacterium]|jgi:pyruvate,orthophosphate dikinase|nr:pyruvate, phosphate dikinase [Acidimicrobiales bacterium]|tara:strand:+ start:2080 stop:4761 length:2682 start_codon:yes stop_codon:yes gene_type:complete
MGQGQPDNDDPDGTVAPSIVFIDEADNLAPDQKKALMGGKGASLAVMASTLSLPVPPAFTITTEVCRSYLSSGWPPDLDEGLRAAVAGLEERTGRCLGDPDNPLLLSVRSGAAISMPGMMDTVLNLGLNDETTAGLARATDERFALDSYRRFVQSYAEVVLRVAADLPEVVASAVREAGVDHELDLETGTLLELIADLRRIVADQPGATLPEDPFEQLGTAVAAVFDSWMGERAVEYRRREGIDGGIGTACTIQAMVFGNRDDASGSGVVFTRDPTTGDARQTGDYLPGAQGEDVVSGTHATLPIDDFARLMPGLGAELARALESLEGHYRDMCDVEFTVEQGRLHILQCRVGKRTGAAALRIASQMVEDPGVALTTAEAVARITPDHLAQVLHVSFTETDSPEVTHGLGASPGAAVGRVYTTTEGAVDAVERGEQVILVRRETSPDDVAAMAVVEGILTSRGGLVSHAAVVARGWGVPCVCGAEQVDVADDHFRVGDVVVSEGDVISIDGTTGSVTLGSRCVVESVVPPELDRILEWADEIASGTLTVRANADTAEDAASAREAGAVGIGLCRTEHMFLRPDRLPLVRQMILAETAEAEAEALGKLGVVQQADFEGVLEAMDGLPVTVRLLDPPLNEFLPDMGDLVVAEARGELDPEGQALLGSARHWTEVNPMMGTRGVRLANLRPGLYRMQATALFSAVVARRAAGGNPLVEVMIPLTVSGPELALAVEWVREAAEDVGMGESPPVGTMIETPRAALLAGNLASHADFFSVGSNDLTQMTFGFSRDDVEGRFMDLYLERGLLDHNPFEHLDEAGVGELVDLAVQRGRAASPGIKVGVCGEHAGDPRSIRRLLAAGVDYLSCSPARLATARLAAAHAVLETAVPGRGSLGR